MKKGTLIILAIMVALIILLAAILVGLSGETQRVSILSPSEGWTQQDISFQAGSEPDRSDLHYSWTFGDGARGDGAQLNHSFSSAGNYSVSLTASDNNGTKFSSSTKIWIRPSEKLEATGSGRLNDLSSELNGKFYANLTLKNIGPSPISLHDKMAIKSYQYSSGSQFVYPEIGQNTSALQLSPGQEISWTSYFDLPLNRTPLSVVYGGWLEAELPFLSLGNLSVYFIDVGQGDSILIETPENEHILIDAGDEAADSVIVDFLQAHSISTIDAFILTHPDSDHIGGADEVLQSFTVLSIYQSGFIKDSTAYRNLASAANLEGCSIFDDNQIEVGDLLPLDSSVRFQVMSINAHASSSNDASLVLKLSYGTVDFLFTGDIDTSVEETMMENQALDLDVEILKVSHHGSKYSTSAAFLAATSPSLAVVCVGENDYGHPAATTLQRLAGDSVKALRTDQNGTVKISTNGEGWVVDANN